MPTVETPLLSNHEKKTNWRKYIAFTFIALAIAGASLGIYFSYKSDNSPSPSPLVDPIVHICGQKGEIKGVWEDGVVKFRGVPYGIAERWQVPILEDGCWTDPLNATVDGKICPQFPGQSYTINPSSKQDEDCLNIDIISRNLITTSTAMGNPKLFPIFFFIYGGSNVIGWPSLYKNIDTLAKMGDFCVFIPSYRLGTLGYLSLRELAARDSRKANVSGNYGLEDLRLALLWTQLHAPAFGCDPTSVTLIGQSSGGTNIMAVLSNSNNKDLFHRAISLSGSMNISMDQTSAEIQGRTFVNNTGCGSMPDVLDCLLKLPTSAVVQFTPDSWSVTNVLPASPAGTPNVGLPHVDGVTVQTDVVTALANGLVDVPVLLQGGLTDLAVLIDPSFRNMSVAEYNEVLLTLFTAWNDTNATGRAIVDAYREITSISVWDSLSQFTTDVCSYCAHISIGQAVAKARTRLASVYVSILEQPPANPTGYSSTLGPFHLPFDGWDYVLATRHWDWMSKFEGGNSSYAPLSQDLKLGDIIRNQWFTFARDNIPAGMLPFVQNTSDYMVNVIGDDKLSGIVVNIQNERAFYCSVLHQHNLTDMQFWLVN